MHTALSPLATGLAANISLSPVNPSAATDWLLLAPYGSGDYHRKEGASLRKYTQTFRRPQAEKMVAAFNALAVKKGVNFRGLPIFAGHPDADPVRWPDERRLGGVVNVAAQHDGLYIKAGWNDLGPRNLTQGYLVYPSPAWTYSGQEASRSNTILPDELQSVGMTNQPNIPTVPAWTNSVAGLPGEIMRGSAQPPADLATVAGRRRAFNERLDELTAPTPRGGRGFTTDQAVQEMRSNPADAALLQAMGA